MLFKSPKNTSQVYWTRHAKEKMRFYGLSEKKVLNLLFHPERVEKGIVPGTIAHMKTVGSLKRQTEIWLLYQPKGQVKKIITAWRYPGRTQPGEEIPIPLEIKKAIENREIN